MAKQKTIYRCSDCGGTATKWAGQCGDCGAWNTLTETVEATVAPHPRMAGFAGESFGANEVTPLRDVAVIENARVPSGLSELDRVLGGGLVPGSVVLIGGDPGIGKSTLLAQALAHLAQHTKTLYVTGEESLSQVRLRVQRLGLGDSPLECLAETSLERMAKLIQKHKPEFAVIDSIQTVYTQTLNSAPGSVSQVRECAAQLVQLAKRLQVGLFLVGHVTKEGQLAGPRVLEHMVDTVLYFEGDSGSRYRLIRAIKNRFGAVNELGIFAMTDAGLKEVPNPSAIFLSRHETSVPGSIIMVTREGSRPLLVEVQALVDECHGANPRRVSLGLEQNRLNMLLAVLHRHTGVAMVGQDVYVNVVGGVRITETGADLAVLLAALSSFRNKAIPSYLVAFGEVGLAGEIRPVPNGIERLKEAEKHGFTVAIVPKANTLHAKGDVLKSMKIIGVNRLNDAIDALAEL